jgi:hypothetical protein
MGGIEHRLDQMITQTDKALEGLAARLDEYKRLDPTERHVFLFWLITQGMTALDAERPILVGGGAVELYTCVRFATGDLDIVAPDRKTCSRILQALGFEHFKNEKYFVSRSLGALIDVHGTRLATRETTVDLVYRKVPLEVVGPEDCIAERLSSYRRHGSSLDLLNAFLIAYHNKDRIDMDHLLERIGSLDLWEQYRAIQDISRELVCHDSGVDEAAGQLIQFMKKGSRPCAF